MLACGMASSTVAMTCTYPLNLIRTRLQMTGVSQVMTTRVPKGEAYTLLRGHIWRGDTGALGMVRIILEEQGFRGLYRGFTANILKVVPATSISYTTYGYLTSRLLSDANV